jgi:hypothetical protein
MAFMPRLLAGQAEVGRPATVVDRQKPGKGARRAPARERTTSHAAASFAADRIADQPIYSAEPTVLSEAATTSSNDRVVLN